MTAEEKRCTIISKIIANSCINGLKWVTLAIIKIFGFSDINRCIQNVSQ